MVARVPEYTDLVGLSRKYFVLASGDRVGGIYLWQDDAAAESLYDEVWRAQIRERYGSDPEVTRFAVLGVDPLLMVVPVA